MEGLLNSQFQGLGGGAATLYCLPFDKLRKFGSKVLHPFFLVDFRPAGRKSTREERKSTALPKAKITPWR
jgi:hypothetical protein